MNNATSYNVTSTSHEYQSTQKNTILMEDCFKKTCLKIFYVKISCRKILKEEAHK